MHYKSVLKKELTGGIEEKSLESLERDIKPIYKDVIIL